MYDQSSTSVSFHCALAVQFFDGEILRKLLIEDRSVGVFLIQYQDIIFPLESSPFSQVEFHETGFTHESEHA